MDSLLNILELAVRWIFCAASMFFSIWQLVLAFTQRREIGVILFVILIVASVVFIGMTVSDTKKFLRGEDF